MIIAVTNLNLFAAIKLLTKNSGYTVLYYERCIPDFLYHLLEKRHHIRECSKRNNPEYLKNVENEKETFHLSSNIAGHDDLASFMEEISDIFCIKKSHIKSTMIKHFVKLIRDDITLMGLVKNKYKANEKAEYWVKNYDIFTRLSNLNDNFIKVSQLRLFDIAYACYISIWPIHIFLFFVNGIFKKRKKQNIKIVFQQSYKKRFGHNPEFEAFFRYFKTRNDVAYHCFKKSDGIYQAVESSGKPAFTTRDLRLPLSEGLLLGSLLFRLVLLFPKYNPPQKTTFWRILLCIFREYAVTKSILLEFSPKYFIRIRQELHENHPVTTGVCELLECSHIGYEHGPPVYFVADYALTDFHYLGVMGKSSMTDIYENCKSDIKWSVLGPITADICYDMPVPRRDFKTITLIADYYLLPWGIFPYESYFNEVFFPLIDFMKNIKNVKLVYRIKAVKKEGKAAYVKNLCKRHNIKCDIEYSASGKDISGFSSYTLRKSDLVVVRGTSTIAFESLSLGKKVIVFCNNLMKHPLESFAPKLAVRSGEEFNKTISWLWGVPYPEYIKSIEHIIRQTCKKANGKMVKEFFEDFVGIDK
ncbi:MAG: hypothetical protein JSV93_05410 [Candidatus Omnitrophota bacterium]|nr:MAG: hypothetical protein JSV93_05410 [Candidatus Omnitrophota bacterium]